MTILNECINNHAHALHHLIQIYQSSVAYSPDAIQTSGGYYHLGRVFMMEGKMDVATSLQTRVSLKSPPKAGVLEICLEPSLD